VLSLSLFLAIVRDSTWFLLHILCRNLDVYVTVGAFFPKQSVAEYRWWVW
jgi:hypothetical protein